MGQLSLFLHIPSAKPKHQTHNIPPNQTREPCVILPAQLLTIASFTARIRSHWLSLAFPQSFPSYPVYCLRSFLSYLSRTLLTCATSHFKSHQYRRWMSQVPPGRVSLALKRPPPPSPEAAPSHAVSNLRRPYIWQPTLPHSCLASALSLFALLMLPGATGSFGATFHNEKLQ